MTAEVIQLRDFKRREEHAACMERLREIGLGIIASAEFQGDLAVSGKEVTPYDPVAVAIMRGHYADTAPCEMPPVQPSYQAPESDPA